MFGTGAYTGDNGETVYCDYVKPENLQDFCKKHCNYYINKIVNKSRNKNTPEIYYTNSAFDRAVEKEMCRILKEEN